MRFEDHFLHTDISIAKLTFKKITTGLALIDSYANRHDYENAQRTTIEVLQELGRLNCLSQKQSDNRLYFHHLMNQKQRWYLS